MPEPQDRDAYLARVAASLDLVGPDAQDVLDELSGHLDDTTEGLRAQGLSDGDAERRALSRLGDPALLGRELSRTTWTRRRLLAAAGGGIRGALIEGVRVWLVLALAALAVSVPVMLVLGQVLPMLGRTETSHAGGPALSALGVAGVMAGFGWVGHALPIWVARSASVTVRAVRRPVAVIGLVASSLFLWLVPWLDLDPVFAAGLPLAPVIFAVTAWQAPQTPGFTLMSRATVALAAAGVSLYAVAILVSAPVAGGDDWYADLSTLGQTPDTVGLADDAISPTWNTPYENGYASAWVDPVPWELALKGAVTSLEFETWPVAIEGGVMHFGPEPLVVAEVPAHEAGTSWLIPQRKDPVQTTRLLVGITPDGSRVLLGEDLQLTPTPVWNGTLAAWWFGG